MNNKVPEIEFHFTTDERDDCALRVADLIIEGYTISEFYYDGKIYGDDIVSEPYIHIKLRRKN